MISTKNRKFIKAIVLFLLHVQDIQVASMATSPNTIGLFDLNDDCLIEIASYLLVADLTKLASTCTRLQDIARRTFVLCPNNKHLSINRFEELDAAELGFDDQYGPEISHEECKTLCDKKLATFNARMEEYLKHFGPVIESIDFDTFVGTHKEFLCNYSVFESVLKYCDAKILNHLTVHDINWTRAFVERVKSFFEQLQKISFWRSWNIELILPKCLNATELTVFFCTGFEECYELRLSELRKFSVYGLLSNAGPMLHVFLLRHMHIKEVAIFPWPVGIDLTILSCLPELEKIELRIESNSVRCTETNQSNADDFGKLTRSISIQVIAAEMCRRHSFACSATAVPEIL